MTQKNIWNISVKELMEKYQVTEQGLTTARAEELRLEKGENILQESRRKSIPEVFISQFADLLVVILIIAAAISMFSGNTESTIVILLVLVINAILGTLQHVKAQRSLDSLRQLSSPGAKVIRDGVKQELPSKDIVPGDIVILEAGDMIVADGRILHSYSLQVNESSLTGESANVEKTDAIIEGDVALADRANMVYSGSMVTYGRAEMLVTATGMETELGKIAGLMNAAKERKTPLQESLDKFSSRLAILIMLICAVVFCLCIYRRMTLLDSMMFAVALAVAAIPEALSSIVTIVQAFGTQKMAKENAIIKNLKAVESLGCVSVICSDKTGTLTQNKMTVQQIYIEDRLYEPDQLDLLNQTHRYLLYDAVLNNDSSIVDDKGIGDPTEYALLEMFRRIEADTSSILKEANMHEDILRQNMQRLEEVPFDSDRKLMSTKYILHGVPTILTKGAVDVLLDRCDYVRCSDDIRPMTEAEKDKIRMQNQLFSENGLRVLSFAYKESDENLDIHAEYGYTFLGLISMVDPPREESAAAVAASKANLDDMRKSMTIQTIGYDKINQLRHVRYFKDINGVREHMKKHAAIMRPKFEAVLQVLENELGGLGIGTWTKPNGGYFISFDALEGCAKAIVAKCKEAGVTLTGAGATFPYKKDPKDSNIRIAPSYPTVKELKLAAKIFVLKGKDVALVDGDVTNIKITYPYDLKLANTILNDKND